MVSETFVIDQAAALVAGGMELDIFARRLEPAGLMHERVSSAGLIARTRFAADHWQYRMADRLQRPYRLCEWLRGRAAIANDADPRPYDVILAHFGTNGLRAIKAVRDGRLRGPVWTVFHGYDLTVGMDEDRHPYADLFAHGDRFLPISEVWASRLERMGAPAERIAVHRMGVDCAAIDFEPRGDGPAWRFLTVCRLVEKKGVEFALRALAELRQAAPDLNWSYVIVGDGPLRPSLEDLARVLDLGDRVRFRGAVSHGEVRRMLADADAFLLPSVTAADGDMEGIPVALMEAMGAGLVVISTVHSGIPELIEHGVSGLLAPERDVSSLAARLLQLLRDPALADSLTRRARQQVERAFNAAKLDADLLEMIRARTKMEIAA